jgi:hypothetical protein
MIGTGDFSGLGVDEMGFLCIRTLASEQDGNLAAAWQSPDNATVGAMPILVRPQPVFHSPLCRDTRL